MGREPFPWKRRPDYQDGQLRHRINWSYGKCCHLSSRRFEIRLCSHSSQLATPAGEYGGTLDNLAVSIIFSSLPSIQVPADGGFLTLSTTTFGLCAISFILAEAIPIFNYLLSLTGAICFAPLALMLPASFWLYDFKTWMTATSSIKKAAWGFHVLMFALGAFICVAGTYSTIELIIQAYAAGEIGTFRMTNALRCKGMLICTGSAFACADNSNSS